MIKKALMLAIVLVLLISNVFAEGTIRFEALDITKDEWVKYFVALPTSLTSLEPLFINVNTVDYHTLYYWDISDGLSAVLQCEDTTDKVSTMFSSMKLDEKGDNLSAYFKFVMMMPNLVFASNPKMSLNNVNTIVGELDAYGVYDKTIENDSTIYDGIMYYLQNDGETFGLYIMSLNTYKSEEAFLEYRNSTMK